MVSPGKCHIAIKEGRHLGDWWSSGGYFRPPPDRMAILVALTDEQLEEMPRAKLFGMLSYWRDYLPDFAARTRRLKALLSCDSAPWTSAHTSEFRAVVRDLMGAAPHLNFAPGEPVVLEVHTGPKGLAALFLQADPAGGRWLPVAAFSRELLPIEMEHSAALLELITIQEALKKLVQIAVYSSTLTIRVSPDVAALFKARLHVSPMILWRICDIQSYGCTVVARLEADEKLIV